MIVAKRHNLGFVDRDRMNYWEEPCHVRGNVYEVELILFAGYDIYEKELYTTYSYLVNDKTWRVNAQDRVSAELLEKGMSPNRANR